jgi:hypothetical protein
MNMANLEYMIDSLEMKYKSAKAVKDWNATEHYYDELQRLYTMLPITKRASLS